MAVFLRYSVLQTPRRSYDAVKLSVAPRGGGQLASLPAFPFSSRIKRHKSKHSSTAELLLQFYIKPRAIFRVYCTSYCNDARLYVSSLITE